MLKWAVMLLLLSFARSEKPQCAEVETCNPGYNLTEFVRELNLQFCTFVEIGQGYCSMFIEFRKNPDLCDLSHESVAEVYLGTCECSTMKGWELCSIPLKKSRPFECSLEDDGEDLHAKRKSRVHRRICDPTAMAELNEPCDCSKHFAQRTLYPVEGFLTCYRTPLPHSICTTHSVCGVNKCSTKIISGLAMIQCDPRCLGKMPFCEERGLISSRAPVLTSHWSDWTCTVQNELIEISEAVCLEKDTNAPAFECLGPGSYCCPYGKGNCLCEVTITMAEMKVTRVKLKLDFKLKTNTELLDKNTTLLDHLIYKLRFMKDKNRELSENSINYDDKMQRNQLRGLLLKLQDDVVNKGSKPKHFQTRENHSKK